MYQHIHDNLFAARLPDGSVHLVMMESWELSRPFSAVPLSSVLWQHTIPAGSWPGLVATVSAHGHKQASDYYEAEALHNRVGAPVAQALGEPSVEMQRRREDGESPPPHARV